MKKIATLGPPGTFSDVATLKYIEGQSDSSEILYYPSIRTALKAIGNTCEIGVLPIENFSEGFIALVLDQLVDADLVIVSEIMLPIQFCFVSKARQLSEINQLFVQFVAKGQCSEFIESLGAVEVVTTESNMESLDRARCATRKSSAIVPSGTFLQNDFSCVVENVNDYKKNQTRFLALAGDKSSPEQRGQGNYKTSIVVLDDKDHPGLLSGILNSFSKREINLTSIISRPTCREFGKYHFFIDFDGHIQDPTISDALEEVRKINKVKILGSYPKGEIV